MYQPSSRVGLFGIVDFYFILLSLPEQQAPGNIYAILASSNSNSSTTSDAGEILRGRALLKKRGAGVCTEIG